jgi:hypothetical protein
MLRQQDPARATAVKTATKSYDASFMLRPRRAAAFDHGTAAKIVA